MRNAQKYFGRYASRCSLLIELRRKAIVGSVSNALLRTFVALWTSCPLSQCQSRVKVVKREVDGNASHLRVLTIAALRDLQLCYACNVKSLIVFQRQQKGIPGEWIIKKVTFRMVRWATQQQKSCNSTIPEHVELLAKIKKDSI